MFNNPFKDGENFIAPKAIQNAVTLTPKMVFGDGWPPYFTPKEWMDYGNGLRPTEVVDLSKFFQLTNAGGIMTGTGQIRTDVGNRSYAYLTFLKPKARVGVKLILEGGMQQLIEDYQEGKITISFTLEDLVAEAKSQI